MRPIRFRIRTIMFAVATLAVLMGAVRALKLSGLRAWAGIQQSDLFIVVSVPLEAPGYFGYQHYVTQIPALNAVGVVGVLIALVPLTVYFWSSGRRRGSALASANRPCRSPAPDQSGQAEKV